MSLNYGTLKTQVLSDAHRPELTSEVANFVRLAEGLIARRLRASEMITRVDLTDSDRVTASEGFFTLPTDFLEVRSIHVNDQFDTKVEPVSLAELRKVRGASPVRHFAILSDAEIEFRGIPSATEEMELLYFARPATFSSDSDTNTILANHETIYLHAAKAALFEFTQDLELAEVAAAVASSAIETLNEQAGRMIGGANTYGAYNLSSFGAY